MSINMDRIQYMRLLIDAVGYDICINADINGSLNIGRKYLMANNLYTDELHNQLVSFMHNPKRITVSVY